MKSTGQIAFEAYNESKGGLTWDGKPIPPWEAIGEAVQTAWQAAADASGVRGWQKAIHDWAEGKGWWDKDRPRSFGDLTMLMVTELAEAYEEHREGRGVTEIYERPEKPGKLEGIPVELADCVIRIFDFAEEHGIDLQEVMARKHAYNHTRAHRHGGKIT
jgi:NTP pyrophosphatase (non-canonical NTP hydrolase)